MTAATSLVHREILAGSLAASSTASLFSPLECVKTRLQVQDDPRLVGRATAGRGGGSPGKVYYRDGFVAALRTVLREDGARLLWTHGFVGFVGRDFLYSGIRIGTYPSFRRLYAGDKVRGDIGLLEKIAAGATTGAVGSFLANPLDVARVRMTVEGGRLDLSSGRFLTGMRKGHRPRWRSTWHCLTDTAAREGVGFAGLWRGVQATMSRAALLSAGQLASYDHSKTVLRRNGWMEEGQSMHVVSAVISGLVATTVCNPADVLKSRLMAAGGGPGCGAPSAVALVRQIVSKEGLLGFMRGWGPAYARAGPTFFIQMPIVEGLRKAFGVDAL